MKKKHHVRLTDSDVEKLKKLIRKKSTSESMTRRCHILLDMNENHGTAEKTYAQCAQDRGVSPATNNPTIFCSSLCKYL